MRQVPIKTIFTTLPGAPTQTQTPTFGAEGSLCLRLVLYTNVQNLREQLFNRYLVYMSCNVMDTIIYGLLNRTLVIV